MGCYTVSNKNSNGNTPLVNGISGYLPSFVTSIVKSIVDLGKLLVGCFTCWRWKVAKGGNNQPTTQKTTTVIQNSPPIVTSPNANNSKIKPPVNNVNVPLNNNNNPPQFQSVNIYNTQDPDKYGHVDDSILPYFWVMDWGRCNLSWNQVKELQKILQKGNGSFNVLKKKIANCNYLKSSQKKVLEAFTKLNRAKKTNYLAHAWGTFCDDRHKFVEGVRIPYMGSLMQPSAEFMTKALFTFIEKYEQDLTDIEKKCFSALTHSMFIHAFPKRGLSKDKKEKDVAEYLYNVWKQEGRISVNTGWDDHATTLILTETLVKCNRGATLVKCNRGARRGKDYKITFYRVDDQLLNDKNKFKQRVVSSIQKLRKGKGNRHSAYFQSNPTRDDGNGNFIPTNHSIDLDLELTQLTTVLRVKEQTVGNCTLASKKTGVYVALYLMYRDEYNQSHKQATESAKTLYKQFTSFVRLFALNEYYQTIKNDPSSIDWFIFARTYLQLEEKQTRRHYSSEEEDHYNEAMEIFEELDKILVNKFDLGYQHYLIATGASALPDFDFSKSLDKYSKASLLITAILAKNKDILKLLTKNGYNVGLIDVENRITPIHNFLVENQVDLGYQVGDWKSFNTEVEKNFPAQAYYIKSFSRQAFGFPKLFESELENSQNNGHITKNDKDKLMNLFNQYVVGFFA